MGPLHIAKVAGLQRAHRSEGNRLHGLDDSAPVPQHGRVGDESHDIGWVEPSEGCRFSDQRGEFVG